MDEVEGKVQPVAVIRFAHSKPGEHNEMPKVVSCNWLPDGEYPVFLATTLTTLQSAIAEKDAEIARLQAERDGDAAKEQGT